MGSNAPNHRTRGPTPPNPPSACNPSAEWDLVSIHRHTPNAAYVEDTAGTNRFSCKPLDRSDLTPGSLSPRCLNLLIGRSKYTGSPIGEREVRVPDRLSWSIATKGVSKLGYSWFRFTRGFDHHGSMNCNAKIVNRLFDVQAYSSFGLLAQLDQFIEFMVSKRASRAQL
ncbi:hypothetical protein CRG98_012462 [Punica granatum]|uniref:Uncharacterized protein n=1 Tax=Punica granatum TaxID=22663 RepID=A0A2I0KF49_PUNGR|nr:hypothetical protein CRG98_012462 [Punica granatum]